MATQPSARKKRVTRNINRNNIFQSGEKRTLREILGDVINGIDVSESFIDANAGFNHLISGGAAWVSGLTFDVTQLEYVMDGVYYKSVGGLVTLGAADATNPRIDVIYVDINGVVGVIEGTAAASPVKPEVDPDTQVEVTFATIDALATTPNGVSDTVIYDEDDDWTTAVSNARIVKAATVNPYAGTKHIHFNEAQNGDYITLTSSTAVQVPDIDTLHFQLYPLALHGNNKNRLRLAWYNGSTRVSDWVHVYPERYGYEDSFGAYQKIIIPASSFNISSTSVNALRIQLASKQDKSYYIDNIYYQKGVAPSNANNYAVLDEVNAFTKAQGSGITELTDAATVSWDMEPGNVYSLTIAGNRTIAAPTNVNPGFTYILLLSQDVTGTRTLTWNSVFKWAGGTAPTLSTAGDALDVISFVADADSNLHGNLGIADSK